MKITKRELLASGLSLLCSPLLAQQKLKVVASFSILADFVKRIGGERVEVTSLVGLDEDAHHFHPRPQDIKLINQADLFFSHGSGFDSWAKKYKAIEITKNLVLEANDPHIWHNAAYMATYALEIGKALSRKDAANGAFYAENVMKITKELFALEAELQEILSPFKSQKIVTNHDAFSYFSQSYGITFVTLQGKLTGEPSAQAIARVINQIKKDTIKAIFVENMKSQKALEQISRETGVKIGGKLLSDSLSKDAPDYFSFMRHNARVIKEALS